MGETWCMPHLHSNVLHTALIFEGGGMRASYTAAVAVALLEAGIHIDWVAGISAGASNTANYISRDPCARGAPSSISWEIGGSGPGQSGAWPRLVRCEVHL